MTSDSALRARRLAAGLTQVELAAAARVSRQLVVAAEAGVNVPSVGAALRLARVLGCSVEALFESPSIKAQAGVRPQPAVHTGCLVIAGCDPALQVAETMLSGAGRAGLLAFDATSGRAMAALRDGGVHAAVAHGPVGRLKQAPVPALRMHLARWQVGLGVAPELASSISSLEACLDQSVPVVQRDRSAAAQQALRRAANALGRELPPGAIASGHAAAARVAAALGCAAITTEAAARSAGLRFIALESHNVEISLDRRWEQHPGVESLGNLLTGQAFQAELGRIGGYDLNGCGSLLGTTEGAR